MNIYPLSDFVRNTRQGGGRSALPCVGADLVVVPGDVLGCLDDLEFLERIDAPVLLVLGNKDFYRMAPEPAMDMDDLVASVRERLAGGNVTLLERDEVVIDGVRFLGGTMWTDVAGLRPLAASLGWAMNDSRYILGRKAWERFAASSHREELLATESEPLAARLRQLEDEGMGSGLMNPLLHAFLHEEFKEWLSPRLQAHFDGPTVVVTHHAPHRRSLEGARISEVVFSRLDDEDAWPRFSEDSFPLCTAAFGAVSDGWLLKSASGRAALWIHGGSHCDNDYAAGGVRVVSNPWDFDPNGANRNAGLERPWMVNPFAGAAPVLVQLGQETLEKVRQKAGEFASFADWLPKAADEVVARALQEAAQARATGVVKKHDEWVQAANEIVVGAGALWPDRLDRVVPGCLGVPLSAAWELKPGHLTEALEQIRGFERMLHASVGLLEARSQYLSRAVALVREKFAAAGYDFTLTANPEGHLMAPLWISVDVKRMPGLRAAALEELHEGVDAELRRLELRLQEDGSFEVIQMERGSSALRAIELRVMVDGDECFDEPDC